MLYSLHESNTDTERAGLAPASGQGKGGTRKYDHEFFLD